MITGICQTGEEAQKKIEENMPGFHGRAMLRYGGALSPAVQPSSEIQAPTKGPLGERGHGVPSS